MIRQLERLTRPVGCSTSGMCALAVYAEAAGDGFTLRAANDQGLEGVACVDDAARAALLYTLLVQRSSSGWAAETARRLLRFVTFMQDDDGHFVNFILDWAGHPNRTGVTSAAGGWWWTARALRALAQAFAVFGDQMYAAAFQRGFHSLQQPTDNLDVRALCVLLALEYSAPGTGGDSLDQAVAWAEDIASARLGDVLPNQRGDSRIHLWGRFQEVALATCGARAGRPDLVRLADASARVVLAPPAEAGFGMPTSIPFDVSCTVQGLEAVAHATHDTWFQERAELARAWFWGRNAAHQAVFDPERGLFYDGIDEGRVNPNSGAESNIEGCLALLERDGWWRPAITVTGAPVGIQV